MEKLSILAPQITMTSSPSECGGAEGKENITIPRSLLEALLSSNEALRNSNEALRNSNEALLHRVEVLEQQVAELTKNKCKNNNKTKKNHSTKIALECDSFRSLINKEKIQENNKTPDEFLSRLHDLIDRAKPSVKGRIICKAIFDGYLHDVPSRVAYSIEFNEGIELSATQFEAIQKYFRHWKTIEGREKNRVNSTIIF